jgi:hypothetical protein
MGRVAVVSAVENLVLALEALGHVVGVKNGLHSSLLEALSAHKVNVDPRDGKNRAAAKRSGGDRANSIGTTGLDDRMAGEERSKVLSNTDGSHTGSTATVRNTEGLVKVQVANISANVTRAAKSDLSIHVGSIHVNYVQ